MARIRTVKPEYFTHPEILLLTIPARLLLLSLLNQADDEGRLYDQPMKIAGQSFGEADRVSVPKLLDELAANERIQRYRVGARDCIQICNFRTHQSISHPRDSVIPPPPGSDDSGSVPGIIPEDSDLTPGGNGKEGNGKEGNGTGKAASAASFEAFWIVYPRKVGKLDAEKAWKAVLKAKADPAEIIEAAKAYAAARTGQDVQFTKHPGPWLRAGRWMDEAEPSDGLSPNDREAIRRLGEIA